MMRCVIKSITFAAYSFFVITHLTNQCFSVEVEHGDEEKNNSWNIKCYSYGCPVIPDDLIKEEVQIKLKFIPANDEKGGDDNDEVVELKGSVQAGSLTLTGYKGGELKDQINQDRAVIVTSFLSGDDEKRSIYLDEMNQIVSENVMENMLIGAFDGHSKGGEIVSQYVIDELPVKISYGLKAEGTTDDDVITNLLNKTFVELDRDAPVGDKGGCTASLLLKLQSKLYFANSGDSRTLLASFNPATNSSDILFITREDKPDLPDEKDRVEKMGGMVYIPPASKPDASSRVVIYDYLSGTRSGLAMSRSIGDRDFGKVGVIPDPIVKVFDLNKLVVENESCLNEESSKECSVDERHIYAVSGTDGLFDELDLSEITGMVGSHLFLDEGKQLATALAALVVTSAQRWGARYRDDIAIVAARLT